MKTAKQLINERLTIQEGFHKGARITPTDDIIEQLMEAFAADMYPKAFVVWWLWGSHPFIAWFDENVRFITDEVNPKRYTLDELFNYWKENVK